MRKLDKAIELLERFNPGDRAEAIALLRELRDSPKSGAEIVEAWWTEAEPYSKLLHTYRANLAQRIDDALASRQTDEPETQRERWQRVADLTGCVVTGDEDGMVLQWWHGSEVETRMNYWASLVGDRNHTIVLSMNEWTEGKWQDRIVHPRSVK